MIEVLNRGRNHLLVKILTQKYFNREAFKDTMKKFWKPTKPICFHELEVGMIMEKFEDLSDKNRVGHDGL